MPALKRVRARRMFLDSELGRLESVDGVAVRAFTSVGALGELAAVWIGPVAVRALIESHRFLEIALSMALHALDLGMLSQQRILRLRVIETLV